jgi:hypothetical protein
MSLKNPEKIAANVERFMNLVGIPDDTKRVQIEEELVSRMAGSADKKPSLVFAQDHLYLLGVIETPPFSVTWRHCS